VTPNRGYSTDLTDAQWAILEPQVPAVTPGGRPARHAVSAAAPPGVDAGDSGKGADWVRAVLGWTVEVVKRPHRWVWLPEGAEPPPLLAGFQGIKRHWAVERTFAWLGRYRRLNKDYEVLPPPRKPGSLTPRPIS
jgi:putative transposase